jgi:hypothetical protein
MITKDKWQHFFTGLGISLILWLAGIDLAYIAFLVMSWAVIKEVLDKLSGKGECDTYDFIWTFNGYLMLIIGLLLYNGYVAISLSRSLF